MLDIKLLREQPDLVRQAYANRGANIDLDTILAADAVRRQSQHEYEQLKAEQNRANAAIAEAKKRGHGAILLVGDAPYYERFGFFADKARHLVMPGPFGTAIRPVSLKVVPSSTAI